MRAPVVLPAFVRRLFGSRWLRAGFAFVVVVFLSLATVNQWHRIGPRLHEITVQTLVAGMICVILGLVATMLAWRSLLSDLGSRVPLAAVWQIFFAGQLGKYVPGSVWPLVMQMELGTAHGVPRQRAVTASVVQMGLAVTTGALISVATLPFVLSWSVSELAWVPLILIVSAVALHPRVANPVLNFGFRMLGRGRLDQQLSWRGLLTASACQGLGSIFFAVPVILVARDLGGSGARIVILAIGAFALSWVIGFLFVLAPAGAGVRETLMIALLGTAISAPSALTVALISRMMLTVGDVLTGGAALTAVGRNRLRHLHQRENDASLPHATQDVRVEDGGP